MPSNWPGVAKPCIRNRCFIAIYIYLKLEVLTHTLRSTGYYRSRRRPESAHMENDWKNMPWHVLSSVIAQLRKSKDRAIQSAIYSIAACILLISFVMLCDDQLLKKIIIVVGVVIIVFSFALIFFAAIFSFFSVRAATSSRGANAPAQPAGGGPESREPEPGSNRNQIENIKASAALLCPGDSISNAASDLSKKLLNRIANESIGNSPIDGDEVFRMLCIDDSGINPETFFNRLEESGYVQKTSPGRWRITDLGRQQIGAR